MEPPSDLIVLLVSTHEPSRCLVALSPSRLLEESHRPRSHSQHGYRSIGCRSQQRRQRREVGGQVLFCCYRTASLTISPCSARNSYTDNCHCPQLGEYLLLLHAVLLPTACRLPLPRISFCSVPPTIIAERKTIPFDATATTGVQLATCWAVDWLDIEPK